MGDTNFDLSKADREFKRKEIIKGDVANGEKYFFTDKNDELVELKEGMKFSIPSLHKTKQYTVTSLGTVKTSQKTHPWRQVIATDKGLLDISNAHKEGMKFISYAPERPKPQIPPTPTPFQRQRPGVNTLLTKAQIQG